MRKKKMVSMLLAFSVLASCVAFGSAVEIDETLTVATEITRKIFKANAKESDTIGYISSTYLQGMDGEEDYILSQCVTGGYAIYEAESMELIEYSDTEFSPYMEFAGIDRYYAGPVNYFVDDGDNLKNVHTKERMSKKHGEKIAKEFKEKTKKDREKRKQKKQQKEKSKDKNSIEENATDEAIEIQSDAMIAPGPTGVHKKDADDYVVQSRVYIEDSQFFIGNHEHGFNFDDTCASVAAQLLLAYNNWAKDGRLIPAQTSNSAEQFLHPDRTENSRLAPYSDIMRGTNSSDISNDGIISLYEKLKEYINPYARSYNEKDTVAEHPQNNGANLSDTLVGIATFISNYSSLRPWDWYIAYEYDEEDTVEVLKDEIDNNRAAIASINNYKMENGQIVKGGHQIVVYGYQTIEFDGDVIDGFVAHFGWNAENSLKNQDKNTHIWFNASWLKGYLTLEMQHIHDEGAPLQGSNNHVYECNSCTAVFVDDGHRYAGGGTVKYAENNPKYNYYHQLLCHCGYMYDQPHSAQTSYVSATAQNRTTHHIVECICGYTWEEPHFYKEAITCWYCHYNPNVQ